MRAREILDSRGNPTVEVDLRIDEGCVRASVPSGASTGSHEAHELRDGGKRFQGRGVTKAVHHIHKSIAPKVRKAPLDQRHIDRLLLDLDGTYNKERLGANALLGVSMASCKAAALAEDVPLYRYIARLAKRKPSMPVPAFNIINGGKHAGNDLAFQEYMLIPHKAKSFAHALRIGTEVYHTLKDILEKKYGKIATNVGDEGGFAPPLKKHTKPLDLIEQAVKECGYKKYVGYGLDAAASEFFKKNQYLLDGRKRSPEKLLEVYEKLAKSYPLLSIEDPFHEEAFEDFASLRESLKKVQVVGDDLLCTNPGRIHQAGTLHACDALLLKANQIGTVTEAIDAAHLAFEQGWKVMVSHRSGETMDPFIADLSVGLGGHQIKAGAPARGERVAKYNQLLRIEEESKLRLGRF